MEGSPHHFFTFVSQFLQGFFKTILLYLSSTVVFLGRFHLLCICLPLISGLLGRSSGQIHSLPERFCGRSPNSSLHLAPGSPNSSLVCLAVFSGFLGRFLAADLFSEKVLRRVPTLLYTCLPTLLYICFPIFSGLLAFTLRFLQYLSRVSWACLLVWNKLLLLHKRCCCFRNILWRFRPNVLCTCLPVFYLLQCWVKCRRPYTSTIQKTVNHVAAAGVFFGLISFFLG